MFDSPIQTDHFAELTFLGTKLSKKRVIKKQIYDKTDYSSNDFKQLNWETFYNSAVQVKCYAQLSQNLNSKYSFMCQSKQFL